jgi:HEAT repeat protein
MHTLINQLCHDDVMVRVHAEHALIHAGDPLPLIALLDDAAAPTEGRWRAAAILGDLADARALEPLIHALADADPEVRNWAAWSLCALNHPAALDALTAIIVNGAADEQVPFMAGLGLIRWDRARAEAVFAQAALSPNEVTRRVVWGVQAYLNHMG